MATPSRSSAAIAASRSAHQQRHPEQRLVEVDSRTAGRHDRQIGQPVHSGHPAIPLPGQPWPPAARWYHCASGPRAVR